MGPLGVPELIVIFIVALVVFGPKKLPELGKSLGRGLREFNKAKNELKATWDEQIREAENHIQNAQETIQAPVRETIAAVSTVNPAVDSIETKHESGHEVKTEAPGSNSNSDAHHETPPSSQAGGV